MLDRIAQILEDLFGIPTAAVTVADHLADDWGVEGHERRAFNAEFCAEFGIETVPTTAETVSDYLELIR